MPQEPDQSLIAPRRLGAVNWIGLWTLYRREVRRFLKVATQTITGPIVTTMLFLIVFNVALGRQRLSVGGLSYVDFLAPGLIMMAMAQNAFANSSSSILIAKVQGTISDFLVSPLGPGELTAGFALGAATRGLLVGLAVGLVMLPVADLWLVHPEFVLFHAAAATLMLGLGGILAGLWAPKMDSLAAVTNFIVTPLTFLSGTFYSITDLPQPFQMLAQTNPFFYMIDGFRYGITGYSDGSVVVGLLVLIVMNLLLTVWVWWSFSTGWRLKQ